MAEFGENIRKAREEKGITQQTLADKLFVSRQAVSRWENGSRYPDLLTAKSLAVALDTTLDKLLDNDDMQNYPDVNPVIEYPLYKRIQTAIFTAAFVTNLVQLIWFICFNLTENRAFQTNYEIAAQIANAISAGLITAVLLFGLIKSIKDTITPGAAAKIAVMLIGVDFINIFVMQYLDWRKNNPASAWSIALSAAIDAAFGSVDACKNALADAAIKRFGSGWGWLVAENGKVSVESTPNAETPITRAGVKPLLVVDVWEHAYYLDWQNVRADYVKAVVGGLLDWNAASRRFA